MKQLKQIAPNAQKVLNNILPKQNLLNQHNKNLELLELNREFEEWNRKVQKQIKEKFKSKNANLALDAQVKAYKDYVQKLLKQLGNDEERKQKLINKLDYKIAKGLSKQFKHQEIETEKYIKVNLLEEIKRNKILVENHPQWLDAHLKEWQNNFNLYIIKENEELIKIYQDGLYQIIKYSLIGYLKINNFENAQKTYSNKKKLLPLTYQIKLEKNFINNIYKYFILNNKNLIKEKNLKLLKSKIENLKFINKEFLKSSILTIFEFENFKENENKINFENKIYNEILNSNLTNIEINFIIEKNIPKMFNYFLELSKEIKNINIYEKFELELKIYEKFLNKEIPDLSQLIQLTFQLNPKADLISFNDFKNWQKRLEKQNKLIKEGAHINYYYLALNKIKEDEKDLKKQEIIKQKLIKNLFYSNKSIYEESILHILEKIKL